jgi:hypothetical protein
MLLLLSNVSRSLTRVNGIGAHCLGGGSLFDGVRVLPGLAYEPRAPDNPSRSDQLVMKASPATRPAPGCAA